MNSTTSPKLILERFAPYRLSIVSNLISDIIAATYKDRFALSITEWRIMAVLGEYPEVSGEEVSVKTQIEKSILSRAIQKLLKRNLVERTIDEQDRRRQVLTLSNLGLDIYRQIVPLSLQHEEKILACFNQKERDQFSSYLDRLQEHAKLLD